MINSLTHWSAWPAVGRSALHLWRSPAMSHARSAQCPLSTVQFNVCGPGIARTREHRQCAGWWPDLAFTATLSVTCAETYLQWVDEHVRRLPGVGCWSVYTGCLDLSGWWQRRCWRTDTSGLPISGVGSSCGTLPVSVHRLRVASTFHSRTEGQTGSKRCRVVV